MAKDADLKAIKDAFRTLAMKYHPDRNKEPGAEERFKEIAEAYAVLSDPNKRSQYDARGFAGVAGFSDQDLFGGINFDDLFGGFNFGSDGQSLFDGFFGHRQRTGPKRGADIEAGISVSLERIAHGGEETLTVGRPVICPGCRGSGAQGGAAARRCDACQGGGRISQSQREDEHHVLIQRISTCPTCHGRGSIIDHPCQECRGSGQVEKQESLTVKIPPGIAEAMVLRLAGKGMPSPDSGGAAGDLLIVVRSKHDPRFERSGADLIRRETIALTEAVLGASCDVATLDGPVHVSIPAGTQPGTVLRLKGKGLPELGSKLNGDLYLHLMVRVPESLSDEERRLYERLHALEQLRDDRGRGQPPARQA